MPAAAHRTALPSSLMGCLLLAGCLTFHSFAGAAVAEDASIAITSLVQLGRALSSAERLTCTVRLEVVVCSSTRPAAGLIVASDWSGTEVLELGRRSEQINPGDLLRIEGDRLLVRRRDFGVQISTAPVLDNDGLHGWKPMTAEVTLKAGRVPLELDWFNCTRSFGLVLEVSSILSNRPPQRLVEPRVWHSPPQTSTESPDLEPGLQVECFEGFWDKVPDFDLATPVKQGVATNVDLALRTRDEMVGLRFTGFFDAPRDGTYSFLLGSDDGSLLFLGPGGLSLTRLGIAKVPAPQTAIIAEPMKDLAERRWASVQGRVTFLSRSGQSLVLELRSGGDKLAVTVADASRVDATSLLNTQVRAVGVGRAALSENRNVVLDRVLVPDEKGLTKVEAETPDASLPLVSISQIQTMRVGEAERQLPARIRGVITATSRSDHWVSLQDDTRGIFVGINAISNSIPADAELWEVFGHTSPGNFAPILVAERMERLGQGRMPEPARPTWNELANGSMDVQWVEFQGLISEVHSNRLTLLLPEGSLDVAMENYFEPDLRRYEQAVVRIRGTLFATWNAASRQVQFGSMLMRNAGINVDSLPPSDPFTAPARSVRDLLTFDAQATALRLVKVRSQVLHADSHGIFTMDGGAGLRVLAGRPPKLQPGDLIEAVGFPEISGPSPLLRQAVIRKTGSAALPGPKELTAEEFAQKGLDSTLVRLEGRLIGVHSEQQSTVLELHSRGQLFVARLKPGPTGRLPLRVGSQLQLTGIYADTGWNRPAHTQAGGFELVLNSPVDIVVRSQPSWWTLERLGAMVGFLVIVLALAAAWISQLRRQVEQRTVQLQREIRERERAERHQVLDAERSRIARDLHDDLGSSLTEIGALANTGQGAGREPNSVPALFDAIAGKARGSIAALDVIVWAVDPEDNSLQSLADYLSGFVREYLCNSGIVCRFEIPVTFPAIMLEGRVRHDLFLAVKEALNNVVRHAGCTEVEFGIGVAGGALQIVIADNGNGFDTALEPEGNGLKNLSVRLGKMGGKCQVESVRGRGTVVKIHLPLPQHPTANAVTNQYTTFV